MSAAASGRDALTADPDRIERCLRTLYGTADAGFLAAWYPTGPTTGITTWLPIEDLGGAARRIAGLNDDGREVYFGVGLHPWPLASGRGKEAGVSALPGLYMDVDYGQVGHKSAANPPTEADALALVDAAPLAPTVVIHTGHGLHCYWLFPEVYAIETDAERRRLRGLNDRLQGAIKRAAAERGWRLDSTGDLSRVLRLAGTIKRKPGCAPVMVRGLRNEGPRYTTDGLDEALPPAVAAPNRPHGPSADDGPAPEGDRPDLERILSACAFMRHWRDDAATLTEPEWFAGMTIVALCRDGERLAHDHSSPYPAYDHQETAAKFARAREADKPMTCAVIGDRDGEPWCRGCPLPRWIKSPIELGHARPVLVVAAPSSSVAGFEPVRAAGRRR
jgi:putative DNA primase/helicase